MKSHITLIGAVAVYSVQLIVARTMQAQVHATLDVGAAAVRYNDTAHVTATTLTPTIRVDAGALVGTAFGTLSSMTQGGWAAQGAVDGSLLSSSVGPLRFEIAGEAGGSLHNDATRTGQYLGRARVHAGSSTRGLWAGVSAGRTWNAIVWQPLAQGDFGAWSRAGRLQMVATVTPSAIGDSLRYTDAQGSLRWNGQRVEIAGGVGARHGDAIVTTSAMAWGGASATLWFTRHVGLVAAGGTYPVDYTQGYPGGSYFSLAFRWGDRPAAFGTDSRRADLQPVGNSAPASPTLQVSLMPNGRRMLRLHAPGARSVEVMGDFTEWKAVGLNPATGGWWTTTVAVQPGMYQLNIRLNDGEWTVPAGTLAAVDEFGTPVGVLVIR
jgi:hypothetical protein